LNTAILGFFDPIHLTLGADFGFELTDGLSSEPLKGRRPDGRKEIPRRGTAPFDAIKQGRRKGRAQRPLKRCPRRPWLLRDRLTGSSRQSSCKLVRSVAPCQVT
jgi:hypothetical protein